MTVREGFLGDATAILFSGSFCFLFDGCFWVRTFTFLLTNVPQRWRSNDGERLYVNLSFSFLQGEPAGDIASHRRFTD
jgi:hypothetical protein